MNKIADVTFNTLDREKGQPKGQLTMDARGNDG